MGKIKKNIRFVIVAVLLWVPLAVVVFNTFLTDEHIVWRILTALLSGPFVVFSAGMFALAATLMITIGERFFAWLFNNAMTEDEKKYYKDTAVVIFPGALVAAFFVIYIIVITGQY